MALASPRFHHQWRPEELTIEKSVTPSVQKTLRARGHKLTEVESFGACQAVAWDPERHLFSGASDPRGSGAAKGW